MRQDIDCPGLQLPRPDGGVREIDVTTMTPEHLWCLFLKPDVNGGYLGKSAVNHLVQKNEDGFAQAYPGGKFSKNGAIGLEAQRACFVEHLGDAARLQVTHTHTPTHTHPPPPPLTPHPPPTGGA